MTTVDAAQACRTALQQQLIAQHSIEDEGNAECGVWLSRTQKDRRKPVNNKLLQEVYQNIVNKHTTFDFVKIHLMLHYDKSVQRFGHIDKNSTKTQEMNHPKMCLGRYWRSKRNFRYEQQVLNDYTRIHVLLMQYLHL
ncbi:hypothetical protein BDD12DRAFT_808667 [Trichophaea hybrida]|nr:hypothetical protein BDD12DRAFT_808667 [Trichophaea hybrida]